ncbi:putative Dynein axonemal heavy chain 2 [Blattamonas nauphoetae]|uniref:Dynein axonemal heavy chain 2 n=1 Tax=Blattamonas nauphoetae TaxID=2049346 RepID=A0ABQ9XWM0_9EUKA|nr:putative Dynein axonemal heavy chain 2 [Blattamonas nauphoetae]
MLPHTLSQKLSAELIDSQTTQPHDTSSSNLSAPSPSPSETDLHLSSPTIDSHDNLPIPPHIAVFDQEEDDIITPEPISPEQLRRIQVAKLKLQVALLQASLSGILPRDPEHQSLEIDQKTLTTLKVRLSQITQEETTQIDTEDESAYASVLLSQKRSEQRDIRRKKLLIGIALVLSFAPNDLVGSLISFGMIIIVLVLSAEMERKWKATLEELENLRAIYDEPPEDQTPTTPQPFNILDAILRIYDQVKDWITAHPDLKKNLLLTFFLYFVFSFVVDSFLKDTPLESISFGICVSMLIVSLLLELIHNGAPSPFSYFNLHTSLLRRIVMWILTAFLIPFHNFDPTQVFPKPLPIQIDPNSDEEQFHTTRRSNRSGVWSCYDEFNRMGVEVLSYFAQQLQEILTALEETCGVFVTVNSGDADRSELPDNLKTLFCPVAVMVPDSAMIIQISLCTVGFTYPLTLAQKIDTVYTLSMQQLSRQAHDGVVSSLVMRAENDESLDEKWIIFDRQADSLRIDSLNSVLTLTNQVRFTFPQSDISKLQWVKSEDTFPIPACMYPVGDRETAGDWDPVGGGKGPCRG